MLREPAGPTELCTWSWVFKNLSFWEDLRRLRSTGIVQELPRNWKRSLWERWNFDLPLPHLLESAVAPIMGWGDRAEQGGSVIIVHWFITPFNARVIQATFPATLSKLGAEHMLYHWHQKASLHQWLVLDSRSLACWTSDEMRQSGHSCLQTDRNC